MQVQIEFFIARYAFEHALLSGWHIFECIYI